MNRKKMARNHILDKLIEEYKNVIRYLSLLKKEDNGDVDISKFPEHIRGEIDIHLINAGFKIKGEE
jgi:hypothetical protein